MLISGARAIFLLSAVFGLAACSGSGPLGSGETPAPAAQVQPQTHVSVGQELGAAVRNRIEVHFASGGVQILPDSQAQLDVAARLFRDVRPVSMFATGYSDAVGEEFANLLLSARRARVVKAALVARGIPANQIKLRAFGESDPIDSADPDAGGNRRVLVTWDIM